MKIEIQIADSDKGGLVKTLKTRKGTFPSTIFAWRHGAQSRIPAKIGSPSAISSTYMGVLIWTSKKQYRAKIVANVIEFLTPRKDGRDKPSVPEDLTTPFNQMVMIDVDDEIPF